MYNEKQIRETFDKIIDNIDELLKLMLKNE